MFLFGVFFQHVGWVALIMKQAGVFLDLWKDPAFMCISMGYYMCVL